ncbi:hypothetical protein E2562_020367 [Oryza meyeriana var. granulata]|uniref:Uncharacterized protein n=1 Tax=Oryza meyeriana var. granulata TaxID=110450 RepID=A0A6G1DM81_9ORYZ|nr:hypothetical protein E2562_020367 [Oryza meyeriana var. granulata]
MDHGAVKAEFELKRTTGKKAVQVELVLELRGDAKLELDWDARWPRKILFGATLLWLLIPPQASGAVPIHQCDPSSVPESEMIGGGWIYEARSG